MFNDLELLLKEYDIREHSKAKSGKKILIIDDDPGIRKALNATFNWKGYDTVLAKTGEEALSLITQDISVVILDIKLPKINGHEVYKLIKEKRKDVPIIFHSAYAGEDAEDCLNLKPFDFIFKGKADSYSKLLNSVKRAIQCQMN